MATSEERRRRGEEEARGGGEVERSGRAAAAPLQAAGPSGGPSVPPTRGPKRKSLGPYVVEGGAIGRGSFAKVYKARHERSMAVVAIKAIDRSRLNRKAEVNLQSEIETLKEMRHDNIVELYDIIETERYMYLVMEYCGGGDLEHLIRSRGPLEESLARHLLQQLASGLEFLHARNTVHRDIKPHNLLLTSSTPPFALKIADFGFAKHMPPQDMADTLCGSPLYMAPEILRGESYGAKADLWSVGAVLFQMVTGRPPYHADSTHRLLRNIEAGPPAFPVASAGGVSDACVDLLKQLLQRDPTNRISFAEFFEHPFLDFANYDRMPAYTSASQNSVLLRLAASDMLAEGRSARAASTPPVLSPAPPTGLEGSSSLSLASETAAPAVPLQQRRRQQQQGLRGEAGGGDGSDAELPDTPDPHVDAANAVAAAAAAAASGGALLPGGSFASRGAEAGEAEGGRGTDEAAAAVTPVRSGAGGRTRSASSAASLGGASAARRLSGGAVASGAGGVSPAAASRKSSGTAATITPPRTRPFKGSAGFPRSLSGGISGGATGANPLSSGDMAAWLGGACGGGAGTTGASEALQRSGSWGGGGGGAVAAAGRSRGGEGGGGGGVGGDSLVRDYVVVSEGGSAMEGSTADRAMAIAILQRQTPTTGSLTVGHGHAGWPCGGAGTGGGGAALPLAGEAAESAGRAAAWRRAGTSPEREGILADILGTSPPFAAGAGGRSPSSSSGVTEWLARAQVSAQATAGAGAKQQQRSGAAELAERGGRAQAVAELADRVAARGRATEAVALYVRAMKELQAALLLARECDASSELSRTVARLREFFSRCLGRAESLLPGVGSGEETAAPVAVEKLLYEGAMGFGRQAATDELTGERGRSVAGYRTAYVLFQMVAAVLTDESDKAVVMQYMQLMAERLRLLSGGSGGSSGAHF